jgi:hypothetical protein
MRKTKTAAVLLLAALAARCTGPSPEEHAAEMARMKEEVRREVLAELQANPPNGAPANGSGAAPASPAPAAPRPDPTTLGAARGRVLTGGQGLGDCRVKLVRLVDARGLLDAFRTFQEGAEFEAVSGPDGSYRFESLPEGSYSARWLPKGESGWIRRLSEKPDVVVKAKSETELADLDLCRVTIVSR